MRIKNAALAAIMAISAHAAVPITRTIDVSATIKPIAIETYAGETLDLSMQLVAGGEALATPSASATIYWQTNGMDNAWWQTNLACTASGMVTGLWAPSLPSGRVWFFVGVNSGGGLNYRIAGQCSILPSPGGTPSTAALPSPGGVLNLADYTIIGAPWITSADSAAAIEAAGHALEGQIRAVSNDIATAQHAAKEYTDYAVAQVASDLDGLAERSDAATSNLATRITNLSDRVDAIVVPDVSGFATKMSLNAVSNDLAEAVQGLSTDLANASNALAYATAALAQTVAANAQQAGYDLAAVSNALANATAALAQTVAYNAQQAGYDLSAASNALAQATAALSQTVAYNAQQASSDLVSATNELLTSLAPTVQLASTALQPSDTNALAQATADLVQKVDGLAAAITTSNTAYRLMSLDGETYQDATGIVWRAAYATNLSPWYVTGISYSNGTVVVTNTIPGIVVWSIDGIDTGVEETGWKWMLYFGGVKVAEISAVAAEDDTVAMFTIGGEISQVDFARTNIVTRYWTPADKVLYESSGVPGGITTNDVQNIVTNTITGFTDWVFTPPTNRDDVAEWIFGYDGGNSWSLIGLDADGYALFSYFADGPEDATSLDFGSVYTATRTYIPPRNALGLARLVDLPPLTNDIPASYQARLPYPTNAIPYSVISGAPSAGGITTNDVCAIITNATASFTQWTITRNDQDVTAQVRQPFYGDTPYGDAWTVYPLEGDSIPDPFLSGPSRDATALNWTGLDEQNETTRYTATRTSVIRNNLGVAGQSGAVNEILLIGQDGKMYHLRIGSGGSIEVYMEAN